MITLLENVGPLVLRASWQAAILALVVVLLVRSLGERISPRWRYLLWSVVVIRLLLVAAPASPWSAFNLVRLSPAMVPWRISLTAADPDLPPEARATGRDALSAAGRFAAGMQSPR